MHLLVCGGTGCHATKSDTLIKDLKKVLTDKGLENEIQVVETGCFGFCEKGPILKVYPDNVFYIEVQPSDAEDIVEEHVIKGRKLDRLLFVEPALNQKLEEQSDMPFYKKQLRVALKNCGFIDPENIDEYIASDGYHALGKVLTSMTPQSVIEEIKTSALRGRGGGGFPTGLKWEFTKKSTAEQKYIVCNADEGDPGAFMDRSILEGDPHIVLEAMAIAGYAVGANKGFIYIRAEYPLAIQRLSVAIQQARNYGLLGNDIMGTGFDFDVDLDLGAGAFVCGEETALIKSIEGNRGEPLTKPPFPAQSGIWEKPTCVNNVETFANIPAIINKGALWFKKIGTEKSTGTKVFALAGKINNVGLVEVPMGITMRDIIFDIGGGIKNKKQFKAVQSGGPSGGCIPLSHIDVPVDYDSLLSIRSMMGSGGLIVLDEDDCMVNVAKFYLEFIIDESCGKCTPCRVGTKRLHEILTKITEGKATEECLNTLVELSNTITDTSLCGLGQTASNPVLSTIEHFLDEYKAHVIDKRCPAGVCQELLSYTVLSNKCIGCTACLRACPVNCIEGAPKEIHKIVQSDCIKCGACYDICRFEAIIKK
ncbi:MAG: NADH-quinone oxidoreductase subunit NuoF [Clostridiales bacterium]|nr:NADH-quinone oxidoreductase subunit NuoF [Clostridiales bacterium]